MSRARLLCSVFLVHVCSAVASEKEPFSSREADEKATKCGLDDFEIDTLAKANYWSVPFTLEHLDKCFIPDGYERHQISSCQLHFSVCRSIPEGVCEGHPNSTACQEVVTEDGLRHYYSIGESQESYEFKPINGHPSFDGFFTVRHGHSIGHHTSRSCHGPFRISIKFVCDRGRVWDPLSHDTSTHVRVIVIIDHCHLEIEFGYSGACQKDAPTLAPAMNTCSLPPYNLTGLTRHEYWFARVPKLCHEGSSNPSVHACTVYFAFCQQLPAIVNDRIKLGPNCTGAAVCLNFLEDGPLPPNYKRVSYSMGQFKNFTGFSYNTELAGGGFNMVVGNGSRTHGTCSIKTKVVLTCNSSAVWSNNDLTKLLSYRHENDNPCEYTLILPYNGACLPVFPNATVSPSTAHPTMTTPTKNNTTSIHPHPTTSIKPHPSSSSHHNTTNSTTSHPPSPTTTRNSTTVSPTSSHHHGPNSTTTTKHPSPTPTRNSTTVSPTSSHHHGPNSTTTSKHPSPTPTRNSTTMTPTSTRSSSIPPPSTSSKNSTSFSSSPRHVSTSSTGTAAFSPTTAAPDVVTTSTTPVDPDRRIILGLIAGVAVSAVLSIVLLVMVVIAVRVLIKKNRKLKFVKLDS